MELENRKVDPLTLDEMIHSQARIQRYKKGEKIFSDGEEVKQIYIIKSGIVRITKKKQEDGGSFFIGVCKDNDFIGDFDLGNFHGKYMTTATMVNFGEIYVLTIEQFNNILLQDVKLGKEFSERMNLFHLREQSKMRDILMHDKRGALYSVLIRLSNSYGVKDGKDVKIKIHLKHHELGDLVGVTRESITRFIIELRNLGVLSMDEDGQLVIHDLSYLRKMSHCENCGLNICQM